VPDESVTIRGLADTRMAEALRAALPAGGAVVSRQAKREVPKWTRKLERSLGSGKVEGTGQSQYLRVGVRPGFSAPTRGPSGKRGKATNPKGTWNRGDPQVYGPVVERGRKDGSVLARPFLVPALTDNVARINAEVHRAIEKALTRMAKGR
jgi:hypothetical protein